jgi:transposase
MLEAAFLDHENSPEVLREFGKIALGEIGRLNEEIARFRKAQYDEEQLRLAYEDRLLKLRNKLFVHGTESLQKALRPRKNDEVLPHGDSQNPDPAQDQKKTAKDRSLCGEKQLYSMTDGELKSEAEMRGNRNSKRSDWEEIKGLYDESTEITIVERVYKTVTHQRKKYRYIPSIGTDKEVIVTAKGPEKLMPGSGFSVDFAIAATCDKYQYHVPLNRQVEQMERRGLSGITAKTLYGLIEALSDHARRAEVLEKIRQDIFSVPLAVHADETPWPILDDRDSDGYIWTICNMAGAYYRFEPSRSGKIIIEMLRGHTGPVLTDDFKGYDRLKRETNCPLAHCWAHARRNFYEIFDHHPEDCFVILEMIDDLFDVEREAKGFEDLKVLRKEKSQGIVDIIKKWCEEKNAKYLLSEDEMGKAIRYLLNNWDEFTLFLKDIRVPLSNNHAERSLRHSVLGRKNYNGSKTINGADVAADHFTIIETCKLVQLEPADYYRYLVHSNNAGNEALSPLGYVRWLYKQKLAAQAAAKTNEVV